MLILVDCADNNNDDDDESENLNWWQGRAEWRGRNKKKIKSNNMKEIDSRKTKN